MKVDVIQNAVYFRMNRIQKCVHKTCKNKRKTCKKHYCNPGCIGTIFEKTYNAKHLQHAKGLHAKNIMLTRKVMFGKKRSVLKNNFYTRLPKKLRNTLKKRGAISGCIEW